MGKVPHVHCACTVSRLCLPGKCKQGQGIDLALDLENTEGLIECIARMDMNHRKDMKRLQG
jgi:hypothetical protein